MYQLILLSQQSYKVDTNIILILKMENIEHRKVKWLAQDHTASRWQSWDLNQGYLVLVPALLNAG